MKKLLLIFLFGLTLCTFQLQATNPISIEAISIEKQYEKNRFLYSFKAFKKARNLKVSFLKNKFITAEKLNKWANLAAICSATSILLILLFYLGIYSFIYLSFALSLAGILLGIYVIVNTLKSDLYSKKERRRVNLLASFAILLPFIFVILEIALNRPIM